MLTPRTNRHHAIAASAITAAADAIHDHTSSPTIAHLFDPDTIAPIHPGDPVDDEIDNLSALYLIDNWYGQAMEYAGRYGHDPLLTLALVGMIRESLTTHDHPFTDPHGDSSIRAAITETGIDPTATYHPGGENTHSDTYTDGANTIPAAIIRTAAGLIRHLNDTTPQKGIEP